MRHIFICTWIRYSHVIYPSIKSNPQVLKCIWEKNVKKSVKQQQYVDLLWAPLFIFTDCQAETNGFNGIHTAPNQRLWTLELSIAEAQGIRDSRDEAALTGIPLFPIRWFHFKSLKTAKWLIPLDECIATGNLTAPNQNHDVCKILHLMQIQTRIQDFPEVKKLIGKLRMTNVQIYLWCNSFFFFCLQRLMKNA